MNKLYYLILLMLVTLITGSGIAANMNPNRLSKTVSDNENRIRTSPEGSNTALATIRVDSVYSASSNYKIRICYNYNISNLCTSITIAYYDDASSLWVLTEKEEFTYW